MKCDLEICCREEEKGQPHVGLTGQPLLASLLLPSVILPSLRILCLVTLDQGYPGHGSMAVPGGALTPSKPNLKPRGSQQPVSVSS